MRVCLIASSRYPVREPFAGGLEALTHQLARLLVRRGHEVTLFAAAGSDPALPVSLVGAATFAASDTARRDVNAPSDAWIAEHHAYLGLMLDLGRTGAARFDVVHNNSLHHLPVAMASLLDVPLITTLHTPPTPWLESAIATDHHASDFAAVSRATAAAWAHVVPSTVVLNGVDTDTWTPGPGGGPAVWSGRLVPEKAPHEAIDAARLAGVPLVLAGPAPDERYFQDVVAPRLGRDAVHVGHLDHRALARLLRRASVAVVTPDWDEPYGLVAAEALACGTPVAAYARGALAELVTDDVGGLAAPGSVPALAAAIEHARGRDRAAARARAVTHLSAERMVGDYEALYARIAGHEAAA
ncbi:glycosyltransferase [Nocardioides sp.]|uniref:glycosyltransferase n=1 Tax=Nocardioides sp. TaxID=35761 RepID=UPI0037835D3F